MPLSSMKQWYKFVLFYLWVAPHALLAVLAVLMFLRRLHKSVPVFFVYAVYETVGFALRFASYLMASGPRNGYRYVFITTLGGSIALRFGIIQEIFQNIFREYSRLEKMATAAMRWITCLLLLAAVAVAFDYSGTLSDDLLAGIALLDRSAAIIQAGLLLFVFLISSMFGLSWRSFVFGIALGFGIFASTDLAVAALHLTRLSEHSRDLLDLLPTGSYHVSVLVWLGYLLTVEKPVSTYASAVPELDRWSEELEQSR